jgi:hypothetical protein
MIERQELPELLSDPLCGRVLRDVAEQNPARADLHGNEYRYGTERRSHGHEKVTGDDVCTNQLLQPLGQQQKSVTACACGGCYSRT